MSQATNVGKTFNNRQKNLLLYKYLFRTTDLLFPQPQKNKFVKTQVRREFQAKSGLTRQENIDKYFNRGHQVITYMMMLHDRQKLVPKTLYKSEDNLSKSL